MDFAIYSTLGLGSLFTIFNLYQGINLLNAKYNELNESNSFTPESLSLFLEKLTQTSNFDQKNFKISENNPTEITGNVFLEGIAFTKHPIKSRLLPHVPLIYSNYYINKIYSNNLRNKVGSIITNDNLLRESIYQVSQAESLIDEAPYFHLFDYEKTFDNILKTIQYHKKTQYNCRIARNLQIDAIGASKLICSRFSFKALTLIERIILFIYLVLEAIFSRQTTIKGIRVGYVEHEIGIKNDSLVNIYGQILYDMKKKTIRMDFPKYMAKNKNSIFNKLVKQIRDKKMIILFLLIPLIISLIKLSTKTFDCFKKWNRSIIIKDKLGKIQNIVIDEVKCSICLININNVILLPCEHFCLCKECYQHRLENNQCPKCLVEIKEIIEVFLP